MTYTHVNRPINEVTPARFQPPGVVAHKEEPLMSTTHRTETSPHRDALADRLQRVEEKLDAILHRLDGGAHDERLGDTLERIEDELVNAAVASTRRDRLILAQLEDEPVRRPTMDPAYNLCDAVLWVDIADALGQDTTTEARELLHLGGVIPITINDDGSRRA